ncbi:unnamed protein product [Parajaminaea phylloscopi]
MTAAVRAYATAVERERRGQLDDALKYYRDAFRRDSSADRLYERAASLLHQSAESSKLSSSHRTAADKQKDALLASPDVADMVRMATDFDDFRVEAIEKAQALAAKTSKAGVDGRGGSKKEAAESSSKRVTGSHAGSRPPSLVGEEDMLDAIVRQAKENDLVEGRDLDNITFRSPPRLISNPAPREPRGSSTEAAQLSEALGHLHVGEHIDAGVPAVADDDEPPPPIAKLPNEVLAHICRCVIEPRGRRGAKVRQPRSEPAVGPVKGKDLRAALGKEGADKGGVTVTPRTEQPEMTATAAATAPKAPQGVGVTLAGPDWQSLEMLARVSWKWRLISRRVGLWRFICDETYLEPQLGVPVEPSLTHPRLTFIHLPRLRLTGCYIAACHYSRPGLSVDNAWVKVYHLVEFFRSIRFLPDGRALTLLTTDSPKETVGKMHAANGDQGFAVGRWRVEEAISQNTSSDGDELDGARADGKLRDTASRHHVNGARVVIDDIRDKRRPKYAFQMILSLRSTSRGKWNKMELLDYRSIHLETGEVCSIPAKHSRPFHFSTVRSYGI